MAAAPSGRRSHCASKSVVGNVTGADFPQLDLHHAVGGGPQRDVPWAHGALHLAGHRFRVVNVMLTNFHPARSTLPVLVTAFDGRELTLHSTPDAASRGYRLLSF